MVILKNQHPTLTERYLFKTYGLYRSISNDQIEKYICIYAGTRTDFPSEIHFDEEQVDPDEFIILKNVRDHSNPHENRYLTFRCYQSTSRGTGLEVKASALET